MLVGLMIAGLLGHVPTATAFAATANPFGGAAPLGRAALGDLRGGMDIGQFRFDFAVKIRSTVEDAGRSFGMTTVLNLDSSGLIASATSRVFGNLPETSVPDISINFGMPGADGSPPTSGQSASSPTSAPPPANHPDSLPDNSTPPPANMADTGNGVSSGTPEALEFTIGDSRTQILHRVARDHFAAIMKNTASGISITQDATVDVKIPNFAKVLRAYKLPLVSRLGRDTARFGVMPR